MPSAIIIGGGPAGLTAAYELVQRSDIIPIVLEQSVQVGGISKTINYKGNRIDIGGHRFFSKSDRVMQWWAQLMPLVSDEQQQPDSILAYQGRRSELISYQAAQSTIVETTSKIAVADPVDEKPDQVDRVMLVRPRKSRIYFNREFFQYPLSLSTDTLKKLGLWKIIKIGMSYTHARLFPLRNESNLEEFFINRFGKELYRTFFKSYTEKVWGVPCPQISASWGAQRIKGLSISKAITYAARSIFKSKSDDVRQKQIETSLIEKFLYPKYGPGQMWELCAEKIVEQGGQITCQQTVTQINVAQQKVVSVVSHDETTGETETIAGDHFFSTMPIKDLFAALRGIHIPSNVRNIAENLQYRDFITVGLLVEEMNVDADNKHSQKLIDDTWIYIQEPDVKLGRLQIFNNWSPYMVSDPDRVWLGLEYFCNEGDELWRMTNDELKALGARELAAIGLIDSRKVIDATVIRVPKTYPAYWGTYEQFDELRAWIDQIENLYLIGRNGMHRYNNQDHSMLTAMTAVENIFSGFKDKSNIWAVNTEHEYHETRKEEGTSST